MNLEDDLRRALRPVPAPPQLADQVLSQIADGQTRTAASNPSWRRWLATAAAVGLIAAGGTRYYQHQQTAEAERIRTEIGLALQITNEKLDLIQRRINDRSGNEVVR